MSEKKLKLYMVNMRQAADLASSYVAGMSEAEFISDARTQQAVVMNLLIIGESASRLLQSHPEFAERHGDVPWQQLKGLRNRAAHHYFGLDIPSIWKTISIFLPILHEKIPVLESDARIVDGDDI